MSLTITQQPSSANLYLYPDGDDTTNLSVYGSTNHYEAVDEIWHSPNDDTDYVCTTSTTNVSDIFTVQNHGSETGNINYVRVIARARSVDYDQSSSGTFRLLISDGSNTSYSSNLAPITTSYMKKYATFTTNPSSGTWSWTDIDSLRIGVDIASTYTHPDEDVSKKIFRPDGDGSLNEGWSGGSPYWDKVDDVVPDEDETRLTRTRTYGDWKGILFTIQDQQYSLGNITSVKVYYRIKKHPQSDDAEAKAAVKTHDTIYYGTAQNLSSSYTTYSYSWTTNPNTGSAWTWDEINDLEAGISVHGNVATGGTVFYFTQLYVEVEYDAGMEIRTTQEYVVVNYNPPQSTVTLSSPTNLNITHSRKIRRHTFPSGDYEVDDYGRASKTLTISGIETNNAYNKMQTLKTMTHYGDKVSISGFPDSNLDTDYHIRSFTYQQQPGQTNVYHWNLVLEED